MDHCGHDTLTCIARVPIFSHLDAKKQMEIHDVIRTRHLEKDDYLYMQDEPASSLYIVNSGRLRIVRFSKSGKEQLIRFLNPGDFSGEMDIFHPSNHRNSAQAVTKTHICEITKEDFNAFMAKYPDITLHFLSAVAKRLALAEDKGFELTTGSVEERVAAYLLDLHIHQESDTVTLTMLRKDLASYLGTTPETLSRIFSQLEKKGFIRAVRGSKIELKDVEGLELI